MPEVVAHQQHRGADVARERRHDVHHLLLDEGIERGGGLVGDEELRAHHQHRGQHDALAHAAGILVRIGAEASRGIDDLHALEHLERALARLLGTEMVVQPQRLHHLEADGERGIQRHHRLLEDHADLAPAHRAHRRTPRRSRGPCPRRRSARPRRARPAGAVPAPRGRSWSCRCPTRPRAPPSCPGSIVNDTSSTTRRVDLSARAHADRRAIRRTRVGALTGSSSADRTGRAARRRRG